LKRGVCQNLLTAALASWAALATPAHGQTDPSTNGRFPAADNRVDVKTFDYRLTPRALGRGVFVVEGVAQDFAIANGCNIINTGFILTDAGVVVINSGPSRRYGEQLRAAIAKVTAQPIALVLNLNLHPDYFLGNQAFSIADQGSTLAATELTIQGIKAESASYESNLFRLCGDWMKDTETSLPKQVLRPGPLLIGERRLHLIELEGHTASDLVVLDEASGVMFVGGLVFVDRMATMPHARIKPWLTSLAQLEARSFSTMVPSHGRLVSTGYGIAQTRDYLHWLDRDLDQSARRGDEMLEVLQRKLPERFQAMAVSATEHRRNVTSMYPHYESAVLQHK
jgi:quinoprotein relay system zinc metallohydrolase 1